ncbi:MAG: HAMP domain-containing protein [Proteobacteria bacterium]|nr:HAMP domain-containing protein [Pseudomonadota bacterium]
MLKNIKIAPRLILIGGLLILIPLVIVGTVAINRAVVGLNQAADEQLATRSMGIAKVVGTIMEEQLRFVIALTIIPDMIRTAETVNSGGIDGTGEELDRLNDYFRRILETKLLGAHVQVVGMVDPNGTIVAASAKKYIGVKIPDRRYFQTARSGKPNIGEVALNKVTGEPFLSFAAPIRSSAGTIVGVVIYIYDIGFLNTLIGDEKIGDTGYAFIADQMGLTISHPNPDHVMKTNLNDLKGMETFAKHMKEGKTGVDHYEFRGVSKTAGYAPIEATGWSVALTLPDSEYLAAVSQMRTIIVGVGIVVILISLIVFFFFALSLADGLKKGVEFAETMSEGDLSKKLEIDRKDEIGDLAGSLNQMVGGLSRMIRNIHNGSSSLSATSSELRNVAEVLSAESDSTADKANTVAAATQEMNSNIESVATAMDQASANVNNIAAAVEEMNANSNDITDRIRKTRESTNYAAEVSANSSVQVNELGQAAAEIESITETIFTIADKTSLLALNATIEAARAGDAGKGFAVVAGEIKGLAQQVSESTGDIGKKINAIQATTDTAIKGIREIADVIAQVSESVDSITTSMQQQNAATKEISGNIGQTSLGLKEINENISQTSQAVAQVSNEINNVNQSAGEISASSAQVEQSSDNLLILAERLGRQVSEFKIAGQGFSAGSIKLAHSNWKRKLADLMSGRQALDTSDVSSHKDCEFGQWYFGPGIEQFGKNDTFQKIDGRHKKVHEMAKEITRLYNDGRIDEANKIYSDISLITNDLFALLDRLEEEAVESNE